MSALTYPLLTQFITLERSHIPTRKTATKGKHLAKIALEVPSLMNCSVGLLIRYDCSRALVPCKVVTGADQELPAIKTDLEWSIVENVIDCMSSNVTGVCHRISVKGHH